MRFNIKQYKLKKYTLSLFLILHQFCSFGLSNLYIEGQVTNSLNGTGIENYKIYIADSSFYNDTITTGANGFYTLFITNTVYNKKYYISVYDCNNINHIQTVFANDAMSTVNFSICYSTAMNCQNSFTFTKLSKLNFSFMGNNISSYPTDYFWDFGDGNTDTGINIIHTFPQSSVPFINYQVKLNTKTIYLNDTCYFQSIQTICIKDTLPFIRGKVSSNDSILHNARVTLYGVNNPPGSCVAVDTAFADNSGNYYFANCQYNYPAFILKAELPSNSTANNLYIPTYYDTLYSWINSPPVYPVTDSTTYDIQYIKFLQNQTTGIGYISGSIDAIGEKKPNSLLFNSNILLINSNNQVLKLTKADLSGNYSFTNLPFASYKVFVELPGKITVAPTVTLNSNTPFVSGLNFIIKDNLIVVNALHIDNEDFFVYKLYPNPVRDKLSIELPSENCGTIQVILYNQLGQVVREYSLITDYNSNKFEFDTHNLQSGIYNLLIRNQGKTICRKIVKF